MFIVEAAHYVKKPIKEYRTGNIHYVTYNATKLFIPSCESLQVNRRIVVVIYLTI